MSKQHDNMKTNEAIAIAACKGDVSKLKALLNENVNPNIKFRKNTPLHWAAQEGKLSTCRLLISFGAKLELKNEMGETPIFKAIEYPSVLSLLIKNGAKVNVRRNGGDTPLHLACAFGYMNTVNTLIENGADTWAKDENARTPMYWAGVYRHTDIKEIIKNWRMKEIEEKKQR